MALPPINLSNLEFQSIYDNLKSYLSNQSEFTDYDFEGSALSTIVDLLAYNTYYQLIFQNILVNEMFLDSAQKLESLRSHAKSHGFAIQNRYSSIMSVKFSSSGVFTYTPYTKHTARTPDGLTRIFYNLTGFTGEATNETTYESTQTLYEAQTAVINQQFTFNYEKQLVFIPNQDFDFRTLVVKVNGVEYRRGNSVEANIYSNNKIYYLESNANGYDIKFVSGMVDPNTGTTIGDVLSSDSIITISYLIPSGSSANGVTSLSADGSVTRTVLTTSGGGRTNLSSDNIKFFIPRTFAAQNRLVTESDIKGALIEAGYASDSNSITLTNPEYGVVYVNTDYTGSPDDLINFLVEHGVAGISYGWTGG